MLNSTALTYNYLIQHYDHRTLKIDLSNTTTTIKFIEPNLLVDYKRLVFFSMDNNTNFDLPLNQTFLRNNVLKSFHCIRCGFSRIYKESFQGLMDLRNLELSQNQLVYISEKAFEQNTKLGYINLQSNQLKVINEMGHLNYLPHLNTLLMSNNVEFRFNKNVPFVMSKRLVIFECANCSIRELLDQTFSAVPNVAYIDLSENEIERINRQTFKTNKQLRSLNLSKNIKLKDHDLEFENSNLRILMCNNCTGLDKIAKHTLLGFPALSRIEFRFCGIQTIDVHAFDHAANTMESILLDRNELTTFPYEAVNRMDELNELCLDFNPLRTSYNNSQLISTYVDRKLRRHCLATLRFDKFENILTEIPDSGVMVLGQLSDIKDTLNKNENSLNLSHKNIFYIEPDVFEPLEHLEILNLEGNNLSLPRLHTFLSHKNIKQISLKSCELDTIYKDTFAHLPNIEIIDLSNNKIAEMSYSAFRRNSKIIELNFDHNRLDSFVFTLVDKLPQLKKLTLNENRFFKFDPHRIFLYNANMEIFECQHCGIDQIDADTFSRMPNLKTLLLANNQIEQIAITSFDHNTKLETLRIDGNLQETIDCRVWERLDKLNIFCFDQVELSSCNCTNDFEYFENITEKCPDDFHNLWSERVAICRAEEAEELAKITKTTTTIITTEVVVTASRNLSTTEPSDIEYIEELHENEHNDDDNETAVLFARLIMQNGNNSYTISDGKQLKMSINLIICFATIFSLRFMY